jgi:GNAT superfamily N-acetyltransferase
MTIKLLTKENCEGFAGIYNEFRVRARSDYCFELEPLPFEDFVNAVEQKFINVLVCYEDEKPAAFLVYTSAISEAVELNVIFSDNVEYSKELVEAFLAATKTERKGRVVCYPMLGVQKEFAGDITNYGFKFVGTAVLRFYLTSGNSHEIFKNSALAPLDEGYKIVPWNADYTNAATEVVHEAFKTSADALFDPRFKSLNGTRDIVDKITKYIYAEFLPEATSVLLYNDAPVGVCFVNITGEAVNIPIVAIRKSHQGKGLSKHMLKNSMNKIFEMASTRRITEINTTTETNNFQALKMYRHLGFREDYNYPQAYLQ